MRLTTVGTLVLLGLSALIVPSWFYSDLVTTGILLTLLLGFITLGSLLYLNKLRYKPTIDLLEGTIEGTSLNPPKCSFKVKTVSFSLFDVFLRLGVNLPYSLNSKTRLSPDFEIIQFSIHTPHRGEWILDGVRFELQDKLRLFKAFVTIPIQASVVAKIPTVETLPLPILSSSVTPGDTYPLSTERLGEPFDLRPYQPGDSMKRILWKTFARSGELITRQPEFSHSPEGEVLIFCAARTKDDYTASLALKYARDAEEYGASLVAGCLGSDETFTSALSFEEGLIGSSFEADGADLKLQLKNFIGNRGTPIVALFLSREEDLVYGIPNLHVFLPSKTFKEANTSRIERFFYYTEAKVLENSTNSLATICRQAGFETTIVE